MATPLISDSQKNTIKAIIDDIHETFARNITVYEEGEKILIAASPEFNGIYGRTSSGQKTTSKTIVSHTLNVRIKYIDAKQHWFSDTEVKSQLDIKIIDGSVRITTDLAGFEIMKKAKRCEFEGRKYTINSKGNPTGMFGPQYYEFYLEPIEE
tara:strand:- start:1491 stop:1949 length:459 start_codon:yes stop_codon:yes gene_type:complete